MISTGCIAMMIGGQSYQAGAGQGRPWTFYALATLFGAYFALSLRPDAGDVRAVVSGAEWRRDISDGGGVTGLVCRHRQAGTDGKHSGVVYPLHRPRLGRQPVDR